MPHSLRKSLAAVAGATADAEQERPTAALARRGELVGELFNRRNLGLSRDLSDCLEKLTGVFHIAGPHSELWYSCS